MFNYNCTYPVWTSHILIVLSLEAETIWSPLGMMATEETLWSWPKNKTKKPFIKWYFLYSSVPWCLKNCTHKSQQLSVFLWCVFTLIKSQTFFIPTHHFYKMALKAYETSSSIKLLLYQDYKMRSYCQYLDLCCGCFTFPFFPHVFWD